MIETLFIGKNSFSFEEMDSTNDWLMKQLFAKKLAEGTLVIAKQQTKGKGQRGATWNAEEVGALTFSILLKPDFLHLSNAFDLSLCVALALSDCLNELRPGFSIKWPNDIYFEDKKIAGVLIENQISKSVYQNAVVGIGLNVNQVNFDDLPNAISLKQITGVHFQIEQVMERVCECLEARYLQLKSGQFESLKAEYISQLYWYRESHFFQVEQNVLEGEIKDVLTDGSLLVAFKDGSVRAFDIKEIAFVK